MEEADIVRVKKKKKQNKRKGRSAVGFSISLLRRR